MKKVVVAALWAAAALTACDKVQETKKDLVSNTLEKVIKKNTGTDVDLPDVSKMSRNAGFVSYKSEDKVFLKGDEKLQATVTFNKDKNQDNISISFQLSDSTGKAFVAAMSKVPENFSLPLKGRFAVSNAYDGVNPTATVMAMNMSNSGMEAFAVPYEGELIITELSENEIKFEINAKGGDIPGVEKPDTWKAIVGSGKITYPNIISIGIDKNSVLK